MDDQANPAAEVPSQPEISLPSLRWQIIGEAGRTHTAELADPREGVCREFNRQMNQYGCRAVPAPLVELTGQFQVALLDLATGAITIEYAADEAGKAIAWAERWMEEPMGMAVVIVPPVDSDESV